MAFDGEFGPILTGLERHGWAVMEDFVPVEVCRVLVQEIEALRASGDLRPAGVGKGDAFQIRADIRSDAIHWLDEANLSPPQSMVWNRLAELRREISRNLYLPLVGFEGHLTAYAPGAAYAKHVDNFRGSSARVLSCIVYLNDGWIKGDGGELALYRGDEVTFVSEVEPRAGTLACFVSAEIPHEVRPAKRIRYSFTGWFLDR